MSSQPQHIYHLTNIIVMAVFLLSSFIESITSHTKHTKSIFNKYNNIIVLYVDF